MTLGPVTNPPQQQPSAGARRSAAVWSQPVMLVDSAAPSVAASTPSAEPEGRFTVSRDALEGGATTITFGLPTACAQDGRSEAFWRLRPTDAVGVPGGTDNPYPREFAYTVWLPRSYGVPTAFLPGTTTTASAWTEPERVTTRDTRTHLAYVTCALERRPMRWDVVHRRWCLAAAATGTWVARYTADGDTPTSDDRTPSISIERTVEWKGLSYTDAGTALLGGEPGSVSFA